MRVTKEPQRRWLKVTANLTARFNWFGMRSHQHFKCVRGMLLGFAKAHQPIYNLALHTGTNYTINEIQKTICRLQQRRYLYRAVGSMSFQNLNQNKSKYGYHRADRNKELSFLWK